MRRKHKGFHKGRFGIFLFADDNRDESGENATMYVLLPTLNFIRFNGYDKIYHLELDWWYFTIGIRIIWINQK